MNLSKLYKTADILWQLWKLMSCVRLFVTPWTIHGILQARILEWVAFLPSPGDHPNQGIEPRSPALQVDSLSAEPQGKPKNTGVGSLSLLQRIFPSQELNRGLCILGRFFYQLSYQVLTITWYKLLSGSLSYTLNIYLLVSYI